MADYPRGRSPFTPPTTGDRTGRNNSNKGTGGNNGNRADDGRRDPYSNDRTNVRDGGFNDRNDRNDRTPRFARREPRPVATQSMTRRAVHYQVVNMGEEEWGDALENRLNVLGHDGWRLIAIDEGRQYVFMQGE